MKAKFRFAILLVLVPVTLGNVQEPQLLDTQEIVSLVNQDRVLNGLEALTISPVLNLVALAKAEDMMKNNYFAHVSPVGLEPWHWFKAFGYNYEYAGENLAEGFSDPSDLELSWMTSESHRANILSPNYSEVGLAVIRHNGKNLVVQMLGSPSVQLSVNIDNK
jgi:uncharacterized protein YkwD